MKSIFIFGSLLFYTLTASSSPLIGGNCVTGQFECADGGVNQCNHGVWIQIAKCPDGSTCVPNDYECVPDSDYERVNQQVNPTSTPCDETTTTTTESPLNIPPTSTDCTTTTTESPLNIPTSTECHNLTTTDYTTTESPLNLPSASECSDITTTITETSVLVGTVTETSTETSVTTSVSTVTETLDNCTTTTTTCSHDATSTETFNVPTSTPCDHNETTTYHTASWDNEGFNG